MPEIDASAWDAFLAQHPAAHVLQTSAWGRLKSAFGWQPLHVQLADGSAGAQVLFRRLPLGLSVAYVPKGPLGSAAAWPSLWRELDSICRRRRAVFLKVEPDAWEGSSDTSGVIPSGIPNGIPAGFRLSTEDVQPARTLLIDLSGSEDEVLARMKQKTRYNIRLAQKKGITVHASADIDSFHRMMLVTGGRDGFGVHSRAYYQRAYAEFHPLGMCELLLAEFEGQALAGVIVFQRAGRAWYFYGASTDEHRERMPTYLLQWEAMLWARRQGCSSYDLWGVPDADEVALEAGFTTRQDGLWGVYRFKRGFGGQLLRSPGPWDRVYNPLLYRLYLWWQQRRAHA